MSSRTRAHRLPSIPLLAGIPLVAGILMFAACTGSGVSPGGPAGWNAGGSAGSGGRIVVVTSTTVFADLVGQVGGGHVDAVSLIPNGGDVHTFAPRPLDVERISAARLIVMNGLGLDNWMTRLIADAAATAPVVRLAEDLPGASYVLGENGTPNPHLWLDVANAERYVSLIAGRLAQVDPAHAGDYAAGAAAYTGRLRTLDGWIRARIATIPPDGRRLVSFHDAFPYFARAYGLEIVGTVVAAPGQEPGAGQVIALIDEIRAAGVKAVFAEAQFNPAIAEAIAQESGARVVTDLYNDTLGKAPADTYEGMMRWDVDRIVGALS